MKARCRIVRMRLPGVDSVDDLGGRLAAHVETCLVCQAEAARYGSLRRRLGGLDGEVYPAPDGLPSAVAIRIGRGEDPPTGRRGVAVKRAAIAVSAAAGAAIAAGAGTVVIIGLRRTHLA